ncbi:MAG: DNA-binding transcriptional regulator Fis [Pseudomonadota bacterium]
MTEKMIERAVPSELGGSRPLRDSAEEAFDAYFGSLNGHAPVEFYQTVLQEVEQPLFRAVMTYTRGNQSRAASILGINRGTLRKKLKTYGMMG